MPLTETVPKALLNVGGKTLLEWQVDSLIECGITEVVFLAGFNVRAVEACLEGLAKSRPGTHFRANYNPFYGIADNLATCWLAREEMRGDFALLNSDTLFSQPVLETLLASPEAPVTVTIDHKARYDDDDMKVELSGTRLLDIGKKLPAERVQGESIGMLLFRGEGPRLFVEALEAAMQEPEGIRQWYLSVIAALARKGVVETVSIAGSEWCEIDYPVDLQTARQMTAAWRRGPVESDAAALARAENS